MSVDGVDTADGPLSIGAVVDGRYRVEAVLGAGGLGVVYRAKHVGLGRPVALKVLHAELGVLEEVGLRFAREAKVLSTLVHPNIVAVSDFGASDGLSYLAMELLEGRTLADALEEGPLDPDAALGIAADMLEGLAFAHSRGVLHRDLKPGNVFLADEGSGIRVKLLDFGLAKMGDPDAQGPPKPTLTRLGTILGTPSYMSPEQATSTPADARSDVYSMGIVLYEMLAGRPPFLEDNRHDTIRAHLVQDVPPPESFRPGLRVRDELRALLAASLAKNHADRPAQAGEMLQALRALPRPAATVVEAGTPLPARAQPVSGEEPTVLANEAKPGRSSRPTRGSSGLGVAVAVIAAALVLLAAVGAGGWLLYEGRSAASDDGDQATSGPSEDSPRPERADRPERAERPTAPAADAGTQDVQPSRPPASDPMARGVPRSLRRVLMKVRRSRSLSRAEIRAVRRYQQDHPDDPRPSLLLGHDHARRDWLSGAIERYSLAHRIDPGSRGNPWMRRDLIEMAASPSHGREAAALVVEVYGEEALADIAAAEARGDLDREALERLERLRRRLEGP